MSTLVELANKSGSDKGTLHAEAHAYSLLYDLLFAPLRYRPIRLAEFGLQTGGPELLGSTDRVTSDVPSIRMWQAYFPYAQLIGLDICDFSRFSDSRFSFYRVDCANQKLLNDTAERVGDLDIVIDDASHASYHQQLTFLEFFPKLRPGGLYVIEDTHWQPPSIEAALPQCALTRHAFADLVGPHEGALSGPLRAMAKQIASVQLVSGDALAALRKDHNRRARLPEHVGDRPRTMWESIREGVAPRKANVHGARAPSSEAKLIVVVKAGGH